MRKTKSLSQLDLESARMGYMDEVRRDARRQMAVVAIVLTCAAALVLGLLYNLLTQ